MKLSMQWLREWVNPEVDDYVISEQLTMIGLEVAGIDTVAQKFSDVLVGEILEINEHPNADKLQICLVDIGSEKLNIVCGDPNVFVGMKAPTAIVGAKLPGDFKIKESKLRGIVSFGMLCSAKDLGINLEEINGVMILPKDAAIGLDIWEYLKFDDHIIELDITPNRGDCLSVLGIAREVAAVNKCEVKKLSFKDRELKDLDFKVNVVDKELCPNYCYAILKNIKSVIQTPLWMKEKLRRSDIRSLSPVVDIMNYIMLELGQPLHAFDLDKLEGGIIVRYAKKGEHITLLTGEDLELSEDTLVIADEKKPIAIAGVMGGLDAAVDETTKNIVIESALFNPEKLFGCAKYYGIQTDSSYRFERGVDPKLQLKALKYALELLIKIVGGECLGIGNVFDSSFNIEDKIVNLRLFRVEKILGINIDEVKVKEILINLGMSVSVNDLGDWLVKIPSYRLDINIEEDLIEEIARLYDYRSITEHPIVSEFLPVVSPSKNSKTVKEFFVSRGYHEIISYSFVEKDLLKILDPENSPLFLSNPLSTDKSAMRTNLWPGLINSAIYNLNHQQKRIRIFEIGLCFEKRTNQLLCQDTFVGGLVLGNIHNIHWNSNERSVDFFDIKGDIELLFKVLGYSDVVVFKPGSHKALHPKCSSSIFINDVQVGNFGRLRPNIAQKLELPLNVYLFSINLSLLNYKFDKKYKNFSRFPFVMRDIAIVVKKEVLWDQLKKSIVHISGLLLQDIQLFDIYYDESIGSDYKSMAIRLIFQKEDRTLVDSEVDDVVKKILLILKEKFNAKLRG